MNQRFNTASAVVSLAILLAGCSVGPWTSAPAPIAPVATSARPEPPAASDKRPTGVDPRAIDQLLAEVQQLNDLDEASRSKLVEELRQTDPTLWPLVMQQFRAAMAYRQQVQRRQSNTASNAAKAGDAASTTGTGEQPPAPAVEKAKPAVAANATSVDAGEAKPARAPSGVALATDQPAPAPAVKAAASPVAVAAPAPVAASTTNSAATSAVTTPPTTAAPAATPAANTAVVSTAVTTAAPAAVQPAVATAAAGNAVTPASYTAATPGDWQTHLTAAIRAKEAELRPEARSPDEEIRHAQLRLLYVLAGRREDALRPIPGASSATQGFWSEEIYGLSSLLDAQRISDPARRAAEARQHFSEAATTLGQACPLVVRNITFCTNIQSYGCIKPFEKYEFTAGQQVLLYAEVENLAAEMAAQGAHTKLRSSYQIFDSRGARVTDAEFTITEEHCQNVRRDYFIGYQLRLPEQIYPGKHTLQLSIEDLISHRIGQTSTEFTVKKDK